MARPRLFVVALIGAVFLTGCGKPIGVLPPNKNDTLPVGVRQFIGSGWQMLQQATGDINHDSKPDYALVVTSNSEVLANTTNGTDFPARQLLVLFQNADGSYLQAATSNSAILCKFCGGAYGDPLDHISIDTTGVLEIVHYGGSRNRWGYTHKFRWQNNGLYLIGKTMQDSDTILLTEETKDYNLLTGAFEHSWSAPSDYKNNPNFSDSDIEQIAQFDRPAERSLLPVRPLLKIENFDILKNIE